MSAIMPTTAETIKRNVLVLTFVQGNKEQIKILNYISAKFFLTKEEKKILVELSLNIN